MDIRKRVVHFVSHLCPLPCGARKKVPREGFDTFGNCPDGWVSFHEKCYLFSSGYASFGGSLAICKSFGAGLVTIEDDHEDNFLLFEVREKHQKNQAFWIGGNDIEVENTFKWIATGKPFNYTKWDVSNGQPDHRQFEDCVVMYMPESGLWHDAPCHDPNHFICEKENESDFVIG